MLWSGRFGRFGPRPSLWRIRHLALGRRGERLAARRLARSGYRILGRNVRLGRDEADLVALAPDGRTVVVVEVKTRSGAQFRGEMSIDARKQRRLVRFATALRQASWCAGRPLRFDAITIVWPRGREPEVRHYEGAFEA